jgi:hypothetical protein
LLLEHKSIEDCDIGPELPYNAVEGRVIRTNLDRLDSALAKDVREAIPIRGRCEEDAVPPRPKVFKERLRANPRGTRNGFRKNSADEKNVTGVRHGSQFILGGRWYLLGSPTDIL